ncbi:ribosome small subunit-dependent GTPase A [Aquisalimonas sp.]|uniref:ribosome small subunit-dependent GTPase A n=1 Tax=Aquisalimonas sp. TaxID=1872621 RepID=UPI0025B9F9B6|nr:ribosome small subunit-dependent GTPase A [Aquisalimonas sp.]
MNHGQVIISFGAESIVETPAGELLRCLTRRRTGRTICGDMVEWSGPLPDQLAIDRIQPRRNTLVRTNYRGQERPLAANLDQLVVVCAPEPTPDPRLLDRYLVLARSLDVPPLVVINKGDLLTGTLPTRMETALLGARAQDCPIHIVSTVNGAGLDALTQSLGHRTSLLAGQSGVGKSSLINRLIPDRQARTQAISEASGQGRHTTTETTLYRLPAGGGLVDSPGVRMLRLAHLSHADIEAGFPDIAPHADRCEFRDCGHGVEPGCAVRAAIAKGTITAERLASLRELLAERNA